MAAATYPSLAGRTMFVTGGAPGVGESFGAQVHARGCKAALKDRQYPDDIARAALLLGRDEARMITGQKLIVDAGRL